jgi:GNAT superfamily N-acetyltransferase
MKAIIRKGEKKDLSDVLRLIKELAEYERAPKEVTNSLQMLEEDGFGSNPIFGFFVAEVNNEIVGMALYYTKYSTWKGKCLFLEDIVITASMRCYGIGSKLFKEVALVAKSMKVARMEWQVLEWNEPAIQFYKKHNAMLDPEWINCKFNFDQLQNLK